MKDFLGLIKAGIFGNPTNPVVSNSKKYQLNKIDVSKVAIHTGVLAGITIVTTLLEYSKLIEFGQYHDVVLIVVNAVGQAALKFLRDNDVNVEPEETV